MSTVAAAERRATELESTAAWTGRLVHALGDPSAWRYTGEMHDAGEGATKSLNPPTCACGHPIRFIFFVEAVRDVGGWRQGDRTQVGSHCVRHLAGMSLEWVEQVLEAAKAAEEAVRCAKAEARRAAQHAVVLELEREWRQLVAEAVARYEAYRARGQRAPYDLWALVASRRWARPRCAPEYRRPADLARWYRQEIAVWKSIMA